MTLIKSLPMKPYSYLVLLLVCLYSCQKSNLNNGNQPTQPIMSDPADQQADTTVPFPFQAINNYFAGGSQPAGCPVLSLYGDTLIFPQPATGEDTIAPMNSPGPGQYFAWPAGMSLNHQTGVIDLTQSQAGMRYAVGFVPAGTKDTCISTLIIGGAAYYDSLMVMGDGDTLSAPYFNASAGLANVCSTPGACSFDYDGQAAKKGVFIDPSTGIIQIFPTLNGKGKLKGLFGAVPKNGSTSVVNIDYRLNDGSHNAPQHIQVKIEYYETVSQIPPGQLNILQGQTLNAENNRLLTMSRNPRPPVIIIVRRN